MSESRKNRRELEEELQQLIRKLEPGRPLGLAIMSILVGMSPVLTPYLIAAQPGPDPRRISNVNLCTSSALISLDFYLPAFTTAFAIAMVLSLTPWARASGTPECSRGITGPSAPSTRSRCSVSH